MKELAKIGLDNEMDLILAHKRAMKLAELAGLSLSAQTTFATAVSEVARYAMEQGSIPVLKLGTDDDLRYQALVAVVEDVDLPIANPLHQGLQSAQRLVNRLEIANTGKESRISLYCHLPSSRKISDERLRDWRDQFATDQPISAYDEIKRKNEQLQELSLRLQASEQHYQQVTNSLPLMIFTANQLGQLLYANAWVTEFTGRSIQHLNQSRWADVLHPDDYAPFWALWTQQATLGQLFQFECRLKEKRTQTYRWHLFSAQPVSADQATITAWTGFVVNIDAQKIIGQTLQQNEDLALAKAKLEQSQQDLEALVTELNQSNAKLTQFAYIASHDLQEPLRKIQQFGDLLKTRSTTLADDELLYLDRILSAAARMSALIKDLLVYSRLSTRQETVGTVPLGQVVVSVLENLSVPVEETKAQVQVSDLPTIQGDITQLIQLFQNLVSNALKFRQPESPPIIHIDAHEIRGTALPASLKPARQAAAYYRIDVADNGIGFDEKYLDRIFQVFQRLHGKNEFPGTGIGLAICEKVAANHGGAITARSEPGHGTTFSVYLPV
ncbi:sensor histidine kinase [Spirosoma koreense]